MHVWLYRCTIHNIHILLIQKSYFILKEIWVQKIFLKLKMSNVAYVPLRK